MNGRKAFIALAGAAALSALGAASAIANDRDDDRTLERGGSVVPCSLSGVNPAFHPEIFGNAATARSFGFVQAPDHTWHVIPGCRH